MSRDDWLQLELNQGLDGGRPQGEPSEHEPCKAGVTSRAPPRPSPATGCFADAATQAVPAHGGRGRDGPSRIVQPRPRFGERGLRSLPRVAHGQWRAAIEAACAPVPDGWIPLDSALYHATVQMPVRQLTLVFPSLLCLAVVAGTASGCAGNLDRAREALTVGDEVEAEAALRQAANSPGSKAEAESMLSRLLADQGKELAASDPKTAEAKFKEALELDASNEDARLGLARLLMKRGFMDDARALLEVENCRGCGRLVAIMLHEQGVKALAAGEHLTARKAFEGAFEVGGDPIDALGSVETYLVDEQPDLAAAKAGLEAAAPLIARGQVGTESKFRELRSKLLLAAAAAKENQLVEQTLAIRTEELEEEPEFDLRFELSKAQFRNGDSSPAIERLTDLIEKSGQYLEPTKLEVMKAALVVMYSARAAEYLRSGDEVGAAKDIAAGLKLDDDNSRLKLQQVLAIAANRLPLAFKELEKLGGGRDREAVEAILWSLQVLEHLANNKLPKAEDALSRAESLSPRLPEVFLARAYVRAEQRNDDLKRKDLQLARQLSSFKYPGGRINRYPSALANLDRARELLEKQGVLHPFHAPSFDARAKALKDKLSGFYPHAVRWYPGKGAVIELASEGGQKQVEFAGPRWLKGTAIASPGKPAEIEVPNAGLVVLDVDGKQVGVVVEDNVIVQVSL